MVGLARKQPHNLTHWNSFAVVVVAETVPLAISSKPFASRALLTVRRMDADSVADMLNAK